MAEPTDMSRPGQCFLCGTSGGPVVVREDGFAGRECTCGVVYIDPMPGHIDPTHDMHVDDYYELPAALRLAWVRHLGPPGRLLDVGAGSGHFLDSARSIGYDVTAIEPNPVFARAVRERGIPVEQALVEDSRLPAASYDVVFHVDLLSHFPDPVRALKSMARLVKPDGVVCFEVGVFGGLHHAWYPWIGRPGFPFHLWFYSESAIRTVLERAGLELVEAKRFGLFPSTIVSTLGRRLLGTVASKSAERENGSARTSGMVRAYCRLQYLMRYRLGAWVPAWGPHALFVAARPIRAAVAPAA